MCGFKIAPIEINSEHKMLNIHSALSVQRHLETLGNGSEKQNR